MKCLASTSSLPKSPHRRGSALSLSIIVSVIITALVLTMAWAAGIQASMTSNITKLDQAFYAAEAGAQRVAWFCKHDQLDSISQPCTGSINGYAYSVTWATLTGKTIRITSRGSLGNVSYTLYQTVAPPSMTGAPVVGITGNFDNKNIDVVGDVQTGGDYSNAGTGSLNGNLTYSGNATNTDSVTGNKTRGPINKLDFDALFTKLASQAKRTYNTDQKNTVFDFTTIPGNNKVIRVNGSVTNPTFIGSGTLYVTGNLSAGNWGSPDSHVTVVVAGDADIDNNVTVYGNLYVKGDWSGAKIDWHGLLYVAGNFSRSNLGQSNITFTGASWFDPRQGSQIRLTNFAGPQP